MKTYYLPHLFDVLARAITFINPTKKDVVQFFRDAGVQSLYLESVWGTLNDPAVVAHSHTRTNITTSVLRELDEDRGAGGSAARVAVIKQVIEFQDFSRCWPHEIDQAKQLVSQVSRLAGLQSSYSSKNAFDRKLFWTATSRSVSAQRLSVLAIAETALAMLISVGIYNYTGSLNHIVFAASIAPFLLLQTPRSTKCALKLAYAATERMRKRRNAQSQNELVTPSRWQTNLLLFLAPLVAQTWALFILSIAKPVSVVHTLLTKPLYSVSRIPANWRRLVICTDSTVPPEPILHFDRFAVVNSWGVKNYHGYAVVDDYGGVRESMYRFAMFRAQAVLQAHSRGGGFVFPLHPIITLLLQLPVRAISLCYRFSIKSTALVWSPLLWIFRPIRKLDNVPHFTRGIVVLGEHQVARAYSTIVIGLAIIKAYIFLYWHELSGRLQGIPGWKDLSNYLMPDRIAIWHVAAFTNALLVWWLYIRATRFLHDIPTATGRPIVQFRQFIIATFFIKNALSVYVSFCLLYITFYLASGITIQPLEIIFFPWQSTGR